MNICFILFMVISFCANNFAMVLNEPLPSQIKVSGVPSTSFAGLNLQQLISRYVMADVLAETKMAIAMPGLLELNGIYSADEAAAMKTKQRVAAAQQKMKNYVNDLATKLKPNYNVRNKRDTVAETASKLDFGDYKLVFLVKDVIL